MSKWEVITHYWDSSVYPNIPTTVFIEADNQCCLAAIFQDRYGVSLYQTTCSCCGSDFHFEEVAEDD